MSKRKYITALDFCAIHEININVIYTRKSTGMFPDGVLKKEGADLYIDENYFIRRIERTRKFINKAHANYYKITEHLNEFQLAAELHSIHPQKTKESWNSFLYEDLFKLRAQNILSTSFPKGVYMFLRYSNWIIKRGFKKQITVKEVTMNKKVDETDDGFTGHQCADMLGVPITSFYSYYAPKITKVRRGIYDKISFNILLNDIKDKPEKSPHTQVLTEQKTKPKELTPVAINKLDVKYISLEKAKQFAIEAYQRGFGDGQKAVSESDITLDDLLEDIAS